MSSPGELIHTVAAQMDLFVQSNRRLAELAQLRRGMRVLDLGAGTGLTARAALEQVETGLSLHLLDRSAASIAEARSHLGSQAATYHVADASAAAEVVGQKLDRVLCNLALWYFTEPERVLRTLRSAMKPTGRLCFTLLGSYFNTGGGVVSPHWALVKLLHQRGDLARPLPEIERLPNQRSIEGTLHNCGFKPFHYEVQEIVSTAAQTEPGADLYDWLRLFPVLPGATHEEAVQRSLAAAHALAGEIAQFRPRWRVVHFMAQPAISPQEALALHIARQAGQAGVPQGEGAQR